MRASDGGSLVYRFDHLLPEHHYHLNLTMYDCNHLRWESVSVDDTVVTAPINLTGDQPRRVSILLDPAEYADHTISVSIAETQGLNAIVAEISLHDVDYRYADAGGSNDGAYTATRGFGFLDGASLTGWGTLPYQTARIEYNDNELRYRFDQLNRMKRYRLSFAFYNQLLMPPSEQVSIDGVVSLPTFSIPSSQTLSLSATVPPQTYADDGSITVSIIRGDINAAAFVNEIALEEITQQTAEAAFTASLMTGPAPLVVTFTNQSTGDFTTSHWDFDDGTTDTATSPIHTYTMAGVYTVTLTVNGPGGTDSETKQSLITVSAPTPTFTITPTLSPTSTATGTATPTLSPTPTWTFTWTLTATAIRTSTATSTPTYTYTPTPTATSTRTSTPTSTQTATRTPTPTAAPSVAIRNVKASPNPFNPQQSTTTLSFDLTAQCGTTVAAIIDMKTGAFLRIWGLGMRAAGTQTITWDGKNTGGTVLAEGLYAYYVACQDVAGNTLALGYDVVNISPVITNMTITPRLYSPQVGNVTLGFNLSLGNAAYTWAVILDAKGTQVRVLSGVSPAGPVSFTWDGRDSAGNVVPNGQYAYVAAVVDPNNMSTMHMGFMLFDVGTPTMAATAKGQPWTQQATEQLRRSFGWKMDELAP